jgi:hypothetical protein
MKRMLFLSSVLFMVMAACGQQASPAASAQGKNVKVTYCQPSKKGRVIFGGLVPYGEIWRTGANKATEISFSKDAIFGGQPVKAGTYTLWTIPTEKEWTVILNTDVNFWGTQHEDHKAKDLVKVKVPSSKLEKSVETFVITLPDDQLTLQWDQVQVKVPIKF